MERNHSKSPRIEGKAPVLRPIADGRNVMMACRMLAVLVALFCISLGGDARAQAYPCPGGPRPGEQIIGMHDPGNGAAQVPMCGPNGSEGPTAPPIGHNSYASIAMHPDAADIWVDGDYSGPGTSERVALEACTKAMGQGCWSTGEWSNSSMAILRDAGGRFFYAWLGDGGDTRKKVLAECSTNQLTPCETFAKVGSGTRRRSPKGNPRKAYAAAAWTSGAVYDGKLYVASGHRTLEEADNAAKKGCSDANAGAPCDIAAWTGNGFIQAYRIDSKKSSLGVAAENSVERVQQAAAADCKQKESATCELDGLFDSRKPGLFVHPLPEIRAP